MKVWHSNNIDMIPYFCVWIFCFRLIELRFNETNMVTSHTKLRRDYSGHFNIVRSVTRRTQKWMNCHRHHLIIMYQTIYRKILFNAKRNAQTVKRTREKLWLLFVLSIFRSELPYSPTILSYSAYEWNISSGSDPFFVSLYPYYALSSAIIQIKRIKNSVPRTTTVW